MNEEIRVHVVKYQGRKNLMMRYLDTMTNKQVARSTRTARRREAERVAAKWEAELQEGRYQKRSRMSWEEFCGLFESDGTGGKKLSTIQGYFDSLAAFKRLCQPRGVYDLTTVRMTAFARELRKPRTIKVGKGEKSREKTIELSEASVARHLRHLKAVCRWANRQGYLANVPTFDMPKGGGSRMKGRPITMEEFERMLEATPKVVGDKAADSWKLLLRGLWASGLRLGEALSLRWDQQPGSVSVILNGQESVWAFDSDSQKSGKVELAPMAPEAFELLEPLQRSRGYVFPIARKDGQPMARDTLKASKIICAIGKQAGVLVNAETGKTASAHDLRRAFGYRWSRLLKTPQLKELMRHASIETTLTYYVGQNAESTSRELWNCLGNTLGNAQERQFAKPLKNQ